MCRARSGTKRPNAAAREPVMLLDCAKLRHWRTVEEQFDELFTFKRDYMRLDRR